MELEIFNTTNCKQAPKGKPCIRLNTKSGTVAFNELAVQKIGLKSGDKVSFAFAKSEKTWYLFFDEANGFSVRNKDKKTPKLGVTFNNSAIVRKMTDENKSLFVGGSVEENGVTYHALIG